MGPNVEIVRRMYEAFHRGDAAAALSFFDPDAVLDATHRVDGRIGRGHEQLTAIVLEWMETWDGWHEDIEEIRDLDGRVLVITTQSGRGRESGVGWEQRFGMLYDMRDGRITRWTIYDDVHRALEAAGLHDSQNENRKADTPQ